LPPLIELDVKIEDIDVRGLFDPGANLTIANLQFLKKIKKKVQLDRQFTFNTMSGSDRILGVAWLKMKIFNIEKRMRFFAVDKSEFRFDVLLGLDSITEYKLRMDEQLNVSQASVNHDNIDESKSDAVKTNEDNVMSVN